MDNRAPPPAPPRSGAIKISQLLDPSPATFGNSVYEHHDRYEHQYAGSIPDRQLNTTPSHDQSQPAMSPQYHQPSIPIQLLSQKRHHDGTIVEPSNSYFPTRAHRPEPIDTSRPTSSSSSMAPSTSSTAVISSSNIGSFLVFPGTSQAPFPESPSPSMPKATATFNNIPYTPPQYGNSGSGSATDLNSMGPPSSKRSSKMMKPPTRSSIACLSCRKSKIKCDNQGPNGACDTCIKAGKRCQYPDGTNPIPGKRPDISFPSRIERDGGERDKKRIKRYGEFLNPTTSQSQEIANEALLFDFLTPELWETVFDLYRLHFSSELPFFHIPTVRQCVNRKLMSPTVIDHESNIVLLGLLALTARFHVDLSKYIIHLLNSSKGRTIRLNSGTDAASGYYARILNNALGPMPGAFTKHGVERVQALLILGVHEWMRGRDAKAASVYITAAINLARNMKLGLEEDVIEARGRMGRSLTSQNHGSPASTNTSPEVAIRSEIRRRTMYSCFILDRFINLGEDVSWLMPVSSISLRLPVSDQALNRGEVNKKMWPRKSSLDMIGKVEFDNPRSYFIRLIEIWGEIAKYSADGGRALDGKNAPWTESKFKRLSDTLDGFIEELMPSFKLTHENFDKFDSDSLSLYISVHMIIALCKIMLHREYVPFVALRCSGPVGPLDPPLLNDAPYDFWLDSAATLFKSSRDITDLVKWAGDRLPASPITLFGVWTSAFVGLYARHFPHMDIHHYMYTPGELGPDNRIPIAESGATGIAFGALKHMAGYMATGKVWVKTFRVCDEMFIDFARRFAERQNKRDGSGEGSPSGIPADTPGMKHLWDEGYGGAITGNGVILTSQSPNHRHQAFPHGGGDESTVATSLPGSPSDREGPETSRDGASAAPSISDADYIDSDVEDETAEMFENLTFMEVVPWIQKQQSERGQVNTNRLLEWAEKVPWGQFSEQGIPSETGGNGESTEGSSVL